MRITLLEKKVKLTEGQEHVFRISLLLGWFWPNLSIQLPNRTINSTPVNALFQLMVSHTDKEIECDEYEHQVALEAKRRSLEINRPKVLSTIRYIEQSVEGKYLTMALSKITTESQTDKTPDEVLAQLTELVKKVYKN